MRITLITSGRRTGLRRRTTLYAVEDGGAVVVVGSNGGRARDPDWVHNLRADPGAVVVRGKREMGVSARELTGTEREQMWQRACAAFPWYGRFQERTVRVIPLFRLDTSE